MALLDVQNKSLASNYFVLILNLLIESNANHKRILSEDQHLHMLTSDQKE